MIEVDHNYCKSLIGIKNQLLIFNNSETFEVLVLDKVISTSDYMVEFINYQLERIEEYSSAPFIDRTYLFNRLNDLKKYLKNRNISKSIDILEELYGYIEKIKKIKIDLELDKYLLKKDTYNPITVTIKYMDGDIPLYNVSVSFDEEDFRIKNIKSIDVLNPKDIKSLNFLALPKYLGKFPVNIYKRHQ